MAELKVELCISRDRGVFYLTRTLHVALEPGGALPEGQRCRPWDFEITLTESDFWVFVYFLVWAKIAVFQRFRHYFVFSELFAYTIFLIAVFFKR